MNKAVVRLSVFSFVLLLFSIGLIFLRLEWVHSYLPWMVFFYWVQFLLMNWLGDSLKNTLDVEEVFILLGGVTARLFVAMIVMVVVAVAKIDHNKLFIINFAVLYLFYLVFEIKGVLSNLRTNLK